MLYGGYTQSYSALYHQTRKGSFCIETGTQYMFNYDRAYSITPILTRKLFVFLVSLWFNIIEVYRICKRYGKSIYSFLLSAKIFFNFSCLWFFKGSSLCGVMCLLLHTSIPIMIYYKPYTMDGMNLSWITIVIWIFQILYGWDFQISF